MKNLIDENESFLYPEDELGLQKEMIAEELQMLFDDYKSGDASAYGRILNIHARYGELFKDEKSPADIIVRYCNNDAENKGAGKESAGVEINYTPARLNDNKSVC